MFPEHQTVSCVSDTPPLEREHLSSVTRLSVKQLTRGFASQPHGWFAISERSPDTLRIVSLALSRVGANPLGRDTCVNFKRTLLPTLTPRYAPWESGEIIFVQFCTTNGGEGTVKSVVD